MNFYSYGEAIDYLRAKVGAVIAARGQLQDAYGRAIVARSKVKTPTQVEQVEGLIQGIQTSLGDQGRLEKVIRDVVPSTWIPEGLGFFPLAPVVVGVGAIGLAGAAYLHLERLNNHKKTLELVERGLLTPQQAENIGGGGMFTGLTGLLTGAAVLYGLTLFGPMIARAVRR